jgi:hypothetical protein
LSRILILIALLPSCSYENDPYLRPGASPERYLITATYPAAGQTGVSRDTAIDLVFDAAPAAETISAADVRLFSGLVETLGSLHADLLERRIRFTPGPLLKPRVRYQVHVSETIRGLNGAKLAESHLFDFTTDEGATPQAPLPAPPTAAPVQAIWNRACAGACHAPAQPRCGLDLSSISASLRTLSNVSATEWSLKRLVPGDHARSYLMRKILDQGGFIGMPMPPAGPSLSLEELRLIADWIDGGARP